MHKQKTIVISAINLFEGGPLSILKDCIKSFEKSEKFLDYKLVALVHKKELFNINEFKNITFEEFPKSRKSYIFRFYYEYFMFRNIAKKYNPIFWLSLHDMTPNIGKIPQAVYCHNASPFNSINFSDLLIQPKQFFFSLFYKYLYKINIKKNKYVIVQQLWIKEKFESMYNLNNEQIIIAKPQNIIIPQQYIVKKEENEKITFFYPTFPRPFKNIEVICEAMKILNTKGGLNYNVTITLDGSENKYAKKIVNKYKNIANINFIGLITREKVYNLYNNVDCLIFSSKLETWGLPLSEFKQFDKPILVADLSYAKETIGKYEKVCFFNPNKAEELAALMENQILKKEIEYNLTKEIDYPKTTVNQWEELFERLIF
jgi:glycosyltransferase involved in cell wall biosynthesis